jgi:hypothetical protein
MRTVPEVIARAVVRRDGLVLLVFNHVFAVRIDTDDPVSREPHLAAGWMRVDELATADVRPRVLVDLVQRLPR